MSFFNGPKVPQAMARRHKNQSLTLAPCFLVRSTGFPLEQLDALRMPASYRRCDELLASRAQIAELCASFTRHLFPSVLDREQQRGAGAPVFRLWYQLNCC